MQIYLISLELFPNNRSFGMGMNLLVHHAYCTNVTKLVVADFCLVSTSITTGVSLVSIRLLPFSTSDNINIFRYSFI